ncbi:COPS8 [Branchiostoma lanceolatum]|uniref:COP9 signalosome complex subunit 8 n=1 Tax=Branchiostoma lanceolatum TaxID=7740 RepID=A0A8J9Z8N0_BRALA|nr:COPS8 [Branchiostoma lanceolatum]
MPCEMAGDTLDFLSLGASLERQELESPGGVATPTVYCQLLAVYLLQKDLNNAKYLWKRIPLAIKNANAELVAIWAVGKKMWQRDFPAIYTSLSAYQWSAEIKQIMAAVAESVRSRACDLVARAYSSISAEDLAAFLGLSVDDSVKAVVERGWQADPQTRMITPKKPAPVAVPPRESSQHLQQFTDLVAFLEN